MVDELIRRWNTVVKVGFICEGKTEKKIIQSGKFQQYLTEIGIQVVGEIIDADGNDHLLPQNLPNFSLQLIDKGADRIVIITDLDKESCITFTKNRINPNQDKDKIVIVAVKEIESWFLADSFTLSFLLKENFEFPKPEEQIDPFEKLRDIFLTKRGRGIGTKYKLARHMLKYGFSVENAAQHPNCPSAAYFLKKLKQLTEN